MKNMKWIISCCLIIVLMMSCLLSNPAYVYAENDEPLTTETESTTSEESQSSETSEEEQSSETSIETSQESSSTTSSSSTSSSSSSKEETPTPEVVKNGLVTIKGKLYYLKNGKKQTGFQTVKGKTYYFIKSGKNKYQAATGWKTLKKKKYYFDPDTAVMSTGIVKINNHTYGFSSKGVMLTGIKKIKGAYYGFKSNGIMRTGWFKSGNYYYYFQENGKAAIGKAKIDGITYTFSSKGKISKKAKAKAEAKQDTVVIPSASSDQTSSSVIKAMQTKANTLTSQSDYLIVVNRKQFRVAIFHKDENTWTLVHIFKCSLGKSGHSTVKGTFKTGPQKVGNSTYYWRAKSFNSSSGRCWYATRFYKHYLFHSVPYVNDTSPKKIRDGRLGQNVSHGCVRMNISHAKWIYDHIPVKTTVHIYN